MRCRSGLWPRSRYGTGTRKILGLKIVSDLNDPFNAAHLTGNGHIEDDPSRFYDLGQRTIFNGWNAFGAYNRPWIKNVRLP